MSRLSACNFIKGIFSRRFIVTTLVILSLIYLSRDPQYSPTAIVGIETASLPRVIFDQSVMLPERIRQKTWIAHEIDLGMSSDGVVFIPRGTVPLTWRDLSWSDIRAMAPSCQTLEAFLATSDSGQTLFLRTRRTSSQTNLFAKNLIAVITKKGHEGNVIISSYDPIFLSYMRLNNSQVVLNYILTRNGTGLWRSLLRWEWFQKQVMRLISPDIITTHTLASAEKLINGGFPVILKNIKNQQMAEKILSTGKGMIHVQSARILQDYSLDRKMYDAGGVNVYMRKVVDVTKEQDVLDAIHEAKAEGYHLLAGGVRYTMGGQALAKGAIYLNMLSFQEVNFNAHDNTVEVSSGTPWKVLQKVLNRYGRAVHIMQSDNIFSVGGSISVNAHGWQKGVQPLVSDVISMRVALANGKVCVVSPTQNSELFYAIVGGYGQFGVILSAQLKTVPNSKLTFKAATTTLDEFVKEYDERVTHNPFVELAYARFNTNTEDMFEKAGIFTYQSGHGISKECIGQEKFVAMKRFVLRRVIMSNMGKKVRWSAEKVFTSAFQGSEISRNTAMSPDVHVIPALRSMQYQLQEYFVPKRRIVAFLRDLANVARKESINIANITLREVHAETNTLLSYAPEDMFSCVLMIIECDGKDENVKLKAFTRAATDRILSLGGSFYLPYNHQASCAQLLKAYPRMKEWYALKKKYDPDHVFHSLFWEKIDACIKRDVL